MFDFLTKKFTTIFSKLKNNKITQKDITALLEQVQDALLEADVPFQLVQEFCTQLQSDLIGQKIHEALKPQEQLVKIVNERIKSFLSAPQTTIDFTRGVMMVMGLQGAGKTTTLAKIANRLKKKTKKILLASVDFYRPAAIEQLEQLAESISVDFYKASQNDPVAAAKEILQEYQKNKYDILLLDTAGRLHIDNQLLQELQTIDLELQPQHKVLVLDSMTGQESLNVAKAFDQAIGFHGAILTKMDSDTRGGAAFSFCYALKKPILFVGIGEKIDDFEQFHADRMTSRILGMGDLVSLAEKADEKISKAEQEKSMKAFMSGKFSLEDFANQMNMMNKLGSMSKLMKYIPGMGSLNISPEMIQKSQEQMRGFKAILSSMTPKERFWPSILCKSRKKRVARGAGMAVSDVNLLLDRFEQSKQYAKLLKRMGRF